MVIGIVMGFAFAACSPSVKVVEPVETPTAELSAIDSLMWRQPDSALAQLQRFAISPAADSLDEFNGHYCQLLVSELLYKNDWKQSNRGELLKAAGYFDSIVDLHGVNAQKRNAFLDARAHYINGVGFYEQGDVVPACKEYMKALKVMEEHFWENELLGQKARFMALTYTHLAGLYSNLYLHEQAIFLAQCSLPYYLKQESPSWNVSWVLNKIGTHFDMMEELDSAGFYYHTAMTALHDTNTIMFRDIAAHQAYLEYKKDSLQADATIRQLRKLLSKSENDLECLSRRASIGEIYYHEKQFDSAWYYLTRVYRGSSSIGVKKQVAEWLVEICKVQGKISEMHEYAEFLVPFANQEENNSVIKSQLTQIFNTFGQTKSERQHQMEAKKRAKQVVVVMGSLSFVMLTIIILYVRNKQHKRKLETQIETERHSHKMQQAALAGRLRQSNAALKEQKTASPITSLPSKQERNGAECYAEEFVCQQILAVCNDTNNSIKSTVPISAYGDIALTDAQKAQLKEAVTRHYGPLFEKLKLLHPELKEKDFLYCYLCLLGLDNMQIAVLTQLSYRTIWEREKRLQALFHTDDRIAVILHEMMMH